MQLCLDLRMGLSEKNTNKGYHDLWESISPLTKIQNRLFFSAYEENVRNHGWHHARLNINLFSFDLHDFSSRTCSTLALVFWGTHASKMTAAQKASIHIIGKVTLLSLRTVVSNSNVHWLSLNSTGIIRGINEKNMSKIHGAALVPLAELRMRWHHGIRPILQRDARWPREGLWNSLNSVLIWPYLGIWAPSSTGVPLSWLISFLFKRERQT